MSYRQHRIRTQTSTTSSFHSTTSTTVRLDIGSLPQLLRIICLATLLTPGLTLSGGRHHDHPPMARDIAESVKMATTSPKPGSTTATNSTTPAASEIPVKPAKDVEYKMVLSSSGPAVLDSAMAFTVELIPQIGNASISNWTTQFIYQWMNMANKAMNRTEDIRWSRLTMTFYSTKVKAGNYPMTVAAFLKDDPTKLVAFQTRVFQLTEKLNGMLVLHQDLVFQRFPHVFATKRKISLQAKVHDRFRESPKPTFQYFWYEGGVFITSTDEPSIDTRVKVVTNITVKSVIYLSFFDNSTDKWLDPGRGDAGSLQTDNGVSKDEMRLRSRLAASSRRAKLFPANQNGRLSDDVMVDGTLPFKKGNFHAPAVFKDQVTHCTLQRVDKQGVSIEADTTAVVEVSCLGSPPIAICLSITKQNHSSEACQPAKFLNDTTQRVQIALNETGWQDVHFFVYNDVSRHAEVRSFYGYTKNPSSILPLTLPIVFSVLGVSILLVGAIYIMRLRKKPLVEVADFDFHPTLTSRLRDSNSITLSRMFNSLRYFLFAREKSAKGDIAFPPELSPTPTDFSPTPTDFSRSPLSESFKSETEHVLYGSL